MPEFVEAIAITRILPCPSEPGKVRVNAEPSRELGELLPYLNAAIKGPIYNPALPALTLNRDGRIITIYPHMIFMAKVRDEADARALLDWIRDALNDVHARRAEIEPVHERRRRLTELEIYKLLPGGNCAGSAGGTEPAPSVHSGQALSRSKGLKPLPQCAQRTCLAFAVELAAGRAEVLRCAPLFDAAHQDKRQVLLELLHAAGYEIPDAFLDPQGQQR